MPISQISTIKVTPAPKEIKLDVTVTTLYKKSAFGFSCYVTGFNFYFSASTEDEIGEKSLAFTDMFFDHYKSHTPRNKTTSRLFMHLYKNGFRPTDPIVLLHNVISKGITQNISFVANKNTTSQSGYSMEKITQSEFLVLQ